MVNSDVMILGAPATAAECAQHVKPLVYGAAGGTVGAFGAGLFGVYKVFKGKPAAGVTSIVAGGLLWFIGRAMMSAAVRQFATCSGTPLSPSSLPRVPFTPPLTQFAPPLPQA